MSAASEITRRAKSNLAFALNILPKERRDDTRVFYAFCRTMDDLADAPGLPPEQRQAALEAWQCGLRDGFAAPDEFQQELVSLRERHQVPNALLLAIIDGCLMDLHPQRFATRDDLSNYIWKVAGAVGLVSIRLFGCQDPASEHYAITLGHALQLTNILRDIGEDLANGSRIYLPLADLARFQYREQDLLARVYDERFLALMAEQAALAAGLFGEAAACLPAADRAALLPARIMGEIYQVLLRQMQRDGFRVFEKRYRVSTARKLAIFSKHLIA
ncbi:MAG: squalene/phytoene synthase family protein [Verrucomicrobia bacterium]|nr:squalene/phytoene synthase family protein [Verrucomicrobiota bacterium]